MHERIRTHSVASAAQVKQHGLSADLIARIEADDAFPLTKEEIEAQLKPENYTGRSPEQVEEFLVWVDGVLEANKDSVVGAAELTV